MSASDGQKNNTNSTVGSVVQNFGIGFAQGAWDAVKNIGQFIAHPIKTTQAAIEGIRQFGNNVYTDPIGTYTGIKDAVIGAYATFKNADANEKARIVGNVTGHVAVDVAAAAATGATTKFAVGKVKAFVKGKPAVGGKSSVLKGQQGEISIRKLYNIGEKRSIKINGRNRIPDGITDTVVSEVKNVESLSLTRQLRDFADYATQNGLSFDLYVRKGAHLSPPLKQFMNQADRNIIYFTP